MIECDKTLIQEGFQAHDTDYGIRIISHSGKRLFIVIYASDYRLVSVIVDDKPDILKPG